MDNNEKENEIREETAAEEVVSEETAAEEVTSEAAAAQEAPHEEAPQEEAPKKDLIFRDRRQMKKKAHKVVRGHYVILMFVTLMIILFGSEYSYSTFGLGDIVGIESEDDPGTLLDNRSTGLITSDALKTVEKDDPGMFGTRRGVLASLVNSFGSGGFAVKMTQAIRSVTDSEETAQAIFIVLSFLGFMAVYILVKNMLTVLARRLFLTARTYKKVHISDTRPFWNVGRWLRAAGTMLVLDIFQGLWLLTIVGYFIKIHSYFAVPYIVAEKPDIDAGEAIMISRKMMDGHKMELFKYELSMIGWIVLGALTFGLSDIFYGAAYRTAAYTEFYVRIREEALQKDPRLAEIFIDPYLYRQADRITLTETYFDVVDEITVIHEDRIELTGARKRAANWFGLWIGSVKSKKAYDAQEERLFAITHSKESKDQLAYPQRLNPYWKDKDTEKNRELSFLRSYTVLSLFLMFIAFSVAGWLWEVSLHMIQTGEFANRGTMYGPWLPIYGTGGVVVLILCSRFRKNPIIEFITAVVLCGIIEYFSSWYLEVTYHQRWWSYDGYFLNLNGRICAEGLLVFGIGCCAVVYMLAPVFDYYVSKLPAFIIYLLCGVLAVLYIGDDVYSSAHPNMAKGAIEAPAPETEKLIAETETETDTEAGWFPGSDEEPAAQLHL